jgi:hypothetical protein
MCVFRAFEGILVYTRLMLFGFMAAALVVAGSAQSLTIGYADCDGAGGTVTYTNISESSADAPLFNAPYCAGNVLDFNPTGFEALQVGAGGNSIDGQLNFSVVADSGHYVDTILLNEFGDYTLLGNDSGIWANATMTVSLEIVELNQGNLTSGIPSLVNQQTSVQFEVPVDISPAGTWSLSASYDLNQILLDAGEEPGAQTKQVNIVLDNTLSGWAGSSDYERITKKSMGVLAVTAAIPEPTAAFLFSMGLLTLAARRKN